MERNSAHTAFTIAGGLAGFTAYGLRGLIFGLLIGHALDFLATVRLSKVRGKRRSRVERSQNLEQLLRLLSTTTGRLASMEAAVSQPQVVAFRSQLSQFQLKRKFEQECLRLFALGTAAPGAAATAQLNFHESVIRIASFVQRMDLPPALIIKVFEAVVNARPTPKAVRALAVAGEILGIVRDDAGGRKNSGAAEAEDGQKRSSAIDESPDPYTILGCRRTDDLTVIKKRYHELLKEYHPDQIQSLQLPQGFIRFANEQVRRLTDAYQSIATDRSRSA